MTIVKMLAAFGLVAMLSACMGMGGGGVQDDEKDAPGGETSENTPL